MWEYISDIESSSLNRVVSDIELKYNYDESEDEFKDSIRITNPLASSFDFNTCTEGLEAQYEETAFQIWLLLNASGKRINKASQLVIESKWTKTANSDNTGKAEALGIIRMVAAHMGRPLKRNYITTKIKSEYRDQNNVDLDLLSFVSVRDKELTNNKPKKGWIESRTVSFERKRYDFGILYDADIDDPLLIRIGKIVKGNFPDTIINGNFPDKIINGTGEQ